MDKLDKLQLSLIKLIVVADIDPKSLLAYDRVLPSGESIGPLFTNEHFSKHVTNNAISSVRRSFKSFRSSNKSKSKFTPLPEDFNPLSGIKLARKTKTILPTWSRNLYLSQFHPPKVDTMSRSTKKSKQNVEWESDESSSETHSHSHSRSRSRSRSQPSKKSKFKSKAKKSTKNEGSQATSSFPVIKEGGVIVTDGQSFAYDYKVTLNLDQNLNGVVNALGLTLGVTFIHRGVVLEGEATNILFLAVQPPGFAGSDIDGQIDSHPPMFIGNGYVLLTVQTGNQQCAELLGKLMGKINEDTSRVGDSTDVAGVRNVAAESLQGLLTSPTTPDTMKVLLELPSNFKPAPDITFLQNPHFVKKWGANVLYPESMSVSSVTSSKYLEKQFTDIQTGYGLIIPGTNMNDRVGIQTRVPEPPPEEDPLEAMMRARKGSGTERPRLSVNTKVDGLAEKLNTLAISNGKFAFVLHSKEPAAIF